MSKITTTTKVVKGPDARKFMSPFGPKPKAGKLMATKLVHK